MNIPDYLSRALDIEQEKFKYINLDIDNLRYFLEEYKPKTTLPNITCFKELMMARFTIKSKDFSEIMESYFVEWKQIRLIKTERIKPNAISIPIKAYYERKVGIVEEKTDQKPIASKYSYLDKTKRCAVILF